MEIDTREMTDTKKRTIYEFLKDKINADDANIVRTPCSKGENGVSKNSYSFKDLTSLNNYFELDKCSEQDSIKKKFKDAITGKGHEEEKIKALHSSSLAAFLFFSKVSEQHQIRIGPVSYGKAEFEVESRCVGSGNNNSAIDVLLTSTDNKHLLYLECKFVEYYLYTGKRSLSAKYFKNDISKKLYDGISKEYLHYYSSGNKSYLEPKSGERELKHYFCDGIKQMISHFVGANNGFASKVNGLQDVWKNAEIKLGTIVFDFGEGKVKPYLDDYRKLYKNFAEVAKGLGTKVGVIKELMTYQEIFQGDNANLLNDKVKQFYGFNND
jgi:hypothetical protein